LAFYDEWRVAAEPAQVWTVVRRVEGWPGWWPSVRSVVPLQNNQTSGAAPRWEFTFRTRLPYTMIFVVELVEEEPLVQVQTRITGRVRGSGTWGVRAVDGGTLVHFDWLVRPELTWMRLITPLARPVFRWNHGQLMAEGGAALAQRVGARLLSPPVTELRPSPRMYS
jgi:hypothetical protein